MAAITDLYRKFLSTSALMKLVILNISIFIILRLLGIIAMIGGWDINTVVETLALPSPLHLVAQRAWTIVTYMFTQYEVFHILFNMLTLYWFGQMMLMRCATRHLVWLYIYGGIAGAIFYLIGAQLFAGVGGWLLGSSASVIAIVIATAAMMPDFRINLLLFGSIRLKWIAIVAFLLFALGLVGDNAAAHIAHFGGMTMGLIFGFLYNKGIDITRPAYSCFNYISSFIRCCFHRNPGNKRKAKFNFRKKATRQQPSPQQTQADDRQNLDAILDKIKRSGYTALTPDERRQLFDISRRVK